MYKNIVMSLCGRLAANGSGSPVSNSFNVICVKQVVYSHHRAKDNLANKQKAILINNILNDMHWHTFLNIYLHLFQRHT